MNNEERRYFSTKIEVRKSDDDSKPKLVGYAAVFNSLSENLGGFREKIDPGAFDGVLDNDVRAVFNHDSNFVLGRTKSGTLKLSVDATGLRYEVDLPDTQQSRDIMTLIERGDVDGSSFKFVIDREGDKWEEDDEGRVIRTISKFARLLDVGPVTFPAYPEASAAKRSLDDFLAKKDCKRTLNDIKLEFYKDSL